MGAVASLIMEWLQRRALRRFQTATVNDKPISFGSLLRFAVKIEEFDAKILTQNWDLVCNLLLSQLEREEVNRFVLPKDKLERLVSRLLQRYAICHAHGFSGSNSGEFQILRTSANKPYLKPEDCAPDLKNWNYSVSHQNQLVVFYSSPVSQIGIDLVQLTDDRHNVQGLSLDCWFQRFHAKLDPEEWLHINQSAEEAGRLARFHLVWGLKEAYLKALGTGLLLPGGPGGGGGGLARAAFRFPPAPGAAAAEAEAAAAEAAGDGGIRLVLDGEPQGQWAFAVHRLEDDFVVCECYDNEHIHQCEVNADGQKRSTTQKGEETKERHHSNKEGVDGSTKGEENDTTACMRATKKNPSMLLLSSGHNAGSIDQHIKTDDNGAKGRNQADRVSFNLDKHVHQPFPSPSFVWPSEGHNVQFDYILGCYVCSSPCTLYKKLAVIGNVSVI